jgi:hypothetical protein
MVTQTQPTPRQGAATTGIALPTVHRPARRQRLQSGGFLSANGIGRLVGVDRRHRRNDAARGLKGKRLIAASDRDFGLFVFRYTGG